MKIICGIEGLSVSDRNEWEQIKNERRIIKLRYGHKKFAWLPIHVDYAEFRWLEFVERRYPAAVYRMDGSLHRGKPEYRKLRTVSA